VKYIVWNNSHGRECAREVRADSAAAAAEYFAKRTDWESNDFAFAKGSDDVVCVELFDEPRTPFRFTIESETRPTYHAKRAEVQNG
jgi:hypothetical protein